MRSLTTHHIIQDGDVLNCDTKAMKLTRGKLLQHTGWSDWQDSEYLQLDQYNSHGMFRDPVLTSDGDAIFHLVWTWMAKRKPAVFAERKPAVFAMAPHALGRCLSSLKPDIVGGALIARFLFFHEGGRVLSLFIPVIVEAIFF
jgi:hypothetical protein